MIKIQVTNKFTGSSKLVRVRREQAWKALNHYRGLISTGSARFVS